jgi:hypothetical protein
MLSQVEAIRNLAILYDTYAGEQRPGIPTLHGGSRNYTK